MSQKTAELRVLVAALKHKSWSTEGWQKVTIATICVDIFRGITESAAARAARGLLKGAYHEGQQLPNFDVWARALALVKKQAYQECEVEIWNAYTTTSQGCIGCGPNDGTSDTGSHILPILR